MLQDMVRNCNRCYSCCRPHKVIKHFLHKVASFGTHFCFWQFLPRIIGCDTHTHRCILSKCLPGLSRLHVLCRHYGQLKRQTSNRITTKTHECEAQGKVQFSFTTANRVLGTVVLVAMTQDHDGILNK